jgi:hypothetical protein
MESDLLWVPASCHRFPVSGWTSRNSANVRKSQESTHKANKARMPVPADGDIMKLTAIHHKTRKEVPGMRLNIIRVVEPGQNT